MKLLILILSFCAFGFTNLCATSLDSRYNLIFNDIFVNPAFTGDSIGFRIKSNLGYGDKFGGHIHITLDKSIQNIKAGIGLYADLTGGYYNSAGILFSKSFQYQKLRIKLGTRLGLSGYKYPEIFMSSYEPERYNRIHGSIGSVVSIKNHTFGLTYNTVLFSKIISEEIIRTFNDSFNNYYRSYDESEMNFIYKTTFQLFRKFYVNPELIDCYDFLENENNLIVSLELRYRNLVSLGISTNSLKSHTLYSKFQIGRSISLGGYVTRLPLEKIGIPNDNIAENYGFLFEVRLN